MTRATDRRSLVSMLLSVLLLGAVGLAALYLFVRWYESNLIYFPTSAYYQTPADAGMKFEEWTLRAADGAKPFAWWIPAASSDSRAPVVLLCHGNGGNIADRVHLAAGLRSQGISTCLLDYRGYGRGEGRLSEEGLYADARAALARILERGISIDRIIFFGESLGGAPATQMAVEHPDCRGLVLDATFTTPQAMSRRVLPIVPVGWMMSLDMDNIGRLRSLKVPVLIFHGDRDGVIPVSMGRELHAAAAGRKKYVEVPGAEHCATAVVMGRPYFETIRQFFINRDTH